MKVVEVSVGKKIEYSVSKSKITFADELMLNCEKLEWDGYRRAVRREVCSTD